ncbi:MAG: response regulator, partial [Armatimonadetes bacterium]|nr:response regulator [Armatimonadota bacterium]
MYRIIVVDDEAVITTQLEEHLTSLGYEVVGAASSGEEAVMLAKELKPDLIIMDIVMPGKINGIIAAEKIQHEIIIPVIFLTAYTDDKYIQKAKNIFPIGYIVKPFKEEELKAIIEIGIYKAEMEKKLRKSEEKFSSFMNTATDLMYITDAHGYLTYVNASMSQALGYSPKELKGMQISQILSLEIQNNFKINREELITSGKLFKESIWITKEGKQIHGEIRLNAIYDNNCNYTGSRGVFRNITKRKQVEESLRESEAKYRRLSENSPAVVYQFIMTPEGAFTFPYVSHVVAATMGISAEDAMKDSSQLLDMVHPEDKEMFREGIIKSAESLESFPLT